MLGPVKHSSTLRAMIALALSIPAAADVVAQSLTSADRRDLAPPGRLVDVGGYRLHLFCTGTRRFGNPTVVLSAGGGDFAVDWGLVQPALAESTRVCSYDRAGVGWSDPGPEPRTLRQEAAELDLLLAKAGEESPYVLVGHSVGALVARAFQERRPSAVAGMVLVDPTHEDVRLGYRGSLVRMRTLATGREIPPVRTLQESPPSRTTGQALEACQAAAAGSAIEPPFSKLPLRDQQYHLWALRHPACLTDQEDYLPDELAAIFERRRQATQPLGETPLVVIAAVPSSAPPGASRDDWQREKANHMIDLAGLSSRGRVVTDTQSGHHIHLDAPAVVIRAIHDVIGDTRRRGP